MTASLNILHPNQISVVLRGEPALMGEWVRTGNMRRTVLYVATILVGAGLYGAAMGSWRDPLQMVYVAIKFPLIVLLTTLGNGLINGMFAPLLGLNLGFRQSLQAVLLSFTIAAAILGSFSPLVFFLIWNAPAMSAHVPGVYSFIQLTHVALIAFAGITANVRLVRLLEHLSGSMAVGRRVLFAWLTVNLFLGSQLVWILRPFIGAPGLPVQFLRPDAFKGNFFEAVWRSIQNLFFS
jgi:hypothetical protein